MCVCICVYVCDTVCVCVFVWHRVCVCLCAYCVHVALPDPHDTPLGTGACNREGPCGMGCLGCVEGMLIELASV